LALEENERLMRRQEDIRLDLNQRANSLQNEMIDFQKKLENQAFLSRERAEAEQRRLLKKEQELQILSQEKEQEFILEQQQVGIQVQDSINSVIRALNATGKYHLVISTSALNNNVLFAAPEYDITQEAIEMLNARYNKK
jgi:outer membrane protein